MELRKRLHKEESIKMKNWNEVLQPTQEKVKEENKPDIPPVVQNTLKPIVIEEAQVHQAEDVKPTSNTIGSVKISVNTTEVKHQIEEKSKTKRDFSKNWSSTIDRKSRYS
jgi:hypothetical protein